MSAQPRVQSRAMRARIFFLLLAISGPGLATNTSEIQKAVSDDALLASAGVEPAKAELRKQCSAAVVETDDPAEFFDCVYVQTSRELNLFTLEDGFLLSELQLTLANMDGVALQHMGRYVQVQIFSGTRVAAIYIHDKNWIDPKQTEAVYQWLLDHGVRPRDPRAWIGP
jgi:hypothetical protein